MELKCTIDGLQFSSAMIVVSTLAVVEEVVATMGALLYFQDYNYFDSTMKVSTRETTCPDVVFQMHLRDSLRPTLFRPSFSLWPTWLL